MPNWDINLKLLNFHNDTSKLIITSEIFIILQLKMFANQVNIKMESLKIESSINILRDN